MRREARHAWTWVAATLVALGSLAAGSGEVNMMFIGGDADAFDLSELRDGEVRTFGDGERRLTATREGDTVSLARESEGKIQPLGVRCVLPQDRCRVVSQEDGKVAVSITREQRCEAGAGGCAMSDMDVIALGDHPGKTVSVRRFVTCEGDHCADKQIEVMALGGDGHEMTWVGDHEPGNVFVTTGIGGLHTAHTDQVLLRCPEGDATLQVAKKEADDAFFCPKHALAMEKAAGSFGHHIKIETVGDAD